MSLKSLAELRKDASAINAQISSGKMSAYEYYVCMFNLILQAHQLGYGVSHCRTHDSGDAWDMPLYAIGTYIRNEWYKNTESYIVIWR